jgi:hypothetical protein
LLTPPRTLAGWLGSPWLPGSLVLVALALRVYHLTAWGFWVDELYTLKVVHTLRDVDAGHFFADLHGPLYNGLAALAVPWLPGEWLRLLSALFSAAAVWPLHAWARRVAGDGTAALAALLAALSPFALWYGQELRNYSLVLLLAPACLLAAEGWRGTGRPGRGAFLAFVLTAWLGTLANLCFLMFLIGLALALLGSAGKNRWRLLGWLAAAAALLVLLCLPWLLSFVDQMAPQRLVAAAPVWDEAPLRGDTTFTPLALPYTLFTLVAGFSYGPSLDALHRGALAAVSAQLPALAVGGIAIALPLIVGWGGLRGRRLEFGILITVTLGLASLLALRNFKVYNVRYVSMVWPLLIVLLAHGVLRMRWPWLRGMAILLLAGVLGIGLGQHYWNPEYAKEDVRGAAYRLNAAGDDLPILVAVVGHPFLHYYRGTAPTAMLWPGMGPAEIRGKVGLLGQPERFRLVSARDWEWGSEAELLASLEGYVMIDCATLQGVRIYTLEKR